MMHENKPRVYFFRFLFIATCLLVISFFAVLRTEGVHPSLLNREEDIKVRLRGPLEPDNRDLIDVIRAKFLVPPASRSLPYVLRHENADLAHEYKDTYPTWKWIDSILKDFYPQQERGFFVEAGALDGEFLSNTLRLEMEQGWTGLLVEPDNDNFDLLLATKRKAWLTRTCLSLNSYPETVVLSKLRENTPIVNWLMRATTFVVKTDEVVLQENPSKLLRLYEEAQCLPTQSLLMALNISHVDFFSLDIEKAEEPMMDHFPFDQITVDVWAIEHRREEVRQNSEDESLQRYTLSDLKRLGFDDKVIHFREQLIEEFEDTKFIQTMISRGYYYFDTTCAYVGDYIFVRKNSDLYERLKVPKHQENRTEICKNKEIHASTRGGISMKSLRDNHHYPSIEYKELE